MKHEWKKHEKTLYLPKAEPELITVPGMNFFCIDGKGNPNDDFFAEYIKVLYAVSFAVRMSPKAGIAPAKYFEYTVYPLEGVWDLSDKAKSKYDGTVDKNELIFTLMIRQPDFVDKDFAEEIIERTKKKKPHKLLNDVRFVSINEGHCVQMMHLGPYDDEPASFRMMEEFCRDEGMQRKTRNHREIYLTDARKTAPEKQKTVLRFQVD